MTDWAAELKATAPDAPPEAETPPDPEAAARELAKLPTLEYGQRRKAEAERLGVPLGMLDAAVKGYRKAAPPDAPMAEAVEVADPWPDPVDGLAEAEGVRRALLAHVVFPGDADADAATLWIIGTFLMDAWRLWPKLLTQSPEKRCGKTLLLEVIEAHVLRGLMTANITGPALFRSIEKWAPTLLIDEADRFLRDNDEVNGIINAGHTRRTARVIRVVEINGTHEPCAFSVWAPQAIASKGSQMDTLEDRSIRIALRRRLESEPVEEIPAEFFEGRKDTRRRLLRWATDNLDRIRALDLRPPACGNDRARNNWTPLCRIAATLGGPWPDRVAAAYAIKEQAGVEAEESTGVMVLRDVMEVFAERGADRLQSAGLVAALVEMEDRPWPEWRHGKAMTAASLARLLKPFGVRPRKLRLGGHTLNGYQRREIEAAHIRYCPTPPVQSGTPEQVNENNDLAAFQSGTSAPNVPVSKVVNPLKNNDCSGVPVCEGGEL
ncbi:MAG: DUF3631 domain-containing protein [Proteobacteria bacterium]|nr:DUF3631 domain-containing protein [Pseudomonadota bacterium]